MKRLLARTLVVATVMAAVSACQPPAPAAAQPDHAATLVQSLLTAALGRSYRIERDPRLPRLVGLLQGAQ